MKTKFLVGAVAGLSFCATFGLQAQVTVATVLTNGLNEPYNIVVDSKNNLYIADSANNRIVTVDANTQQATTLAGIPSDPPGDNDGPSYLAHFNNPEGLLIVNLAGNETLLLSDSGNHLIRSVDLSDGTVTTLAGQPGGGPAVDAAGTNATFRYPTGMAHDANGNVYIADWGNNTIRVMNLNDPVLGVTNLLVSGTTFWRPTAVACVGTNQLWVADSGNQMVDLITFTNPTAGYVTSSLGARGIPGTNDSTFGASARFNGPSGLLWVEGTGLIISDTLNNSIRLATNYPAFGTTNYSVSTFAGVAGPGNGAAVDGPALSARFNSPFGLAQDFANNGFLVADLKNDAIRRIQNGPPLPPVPTPQIGWVDFPPPLFLSVLVTNQPFVFNNDVIIAIAGTAGTETHFTYDTTPANPLVDTVPNPTASEGSTPPGYRNGLPASQVPPTIVAPRPDITIKAIGLQQGRQNSSITAARFQFIAASPSIIGENAANFLVKNTTKGAQMWYTLDGTDPTNAPPSLGPIVDGVNLSIDAKSNLVFKIRAFRDQYANSTILTKTFSASNFVGNMISFGFLAGEASSDFVAAPGQIFYAPVTLSVLPGVSIYSFQFNVTVNNMGTGAPVPAGAFGFESFLEKPNPIDKTLLEKIPPLMYPTNFSDPPPLSSLVSFDGKAFLPLIFTNTSENLLGVGWLERRSSTNLYDTLSQDLIKYSQPHDTLFDQNDGHVVLGGYWFLVPTNAQPGQTYQIKLERASATSDGVGAPGSVIVVSEPTDGSLSNGALNSIKIVTASQRKYVAGDSAPFRWFNAGDFGNNVLDNSDVMQVFQSAIYQLNYPPPGSDFFDSMDSCGAIYVDNGHGYLEPGPFIVNPDTLNGLFDGNDTYINQIAFGDGNLDVCDVFVTFRRSLDPSLANFSRFWTNGVRAAHLLTNSASSVALKWARPQILPAVNFSSLDFLATPGQTLQIPISAKVLGSYPLRVLMLSLTVKPLDGSPTLNLPVQFTPSPVLGIPTLSSGVGNGNYAAAWLDHTINGFTNQAVLGTLTVQIPTNATSSAAYAIYFDHASASPNGLASFPKQTLTGLITLADRSASSFNDAIPDSWRLRYFGTTQNLLSQADADADGDGMSNGQEFIAGTDPLDAKSCLRVATEPGAVQPGAIHWPSIAGKQYVVERSTDLFGSNWIPLATIAGNGGQLQYQDSQSGDHRFYRVRVTQ
jgi:sugar lactone lactonase YvrE